MRAIGYLRVSTDAQDTDNQRHEVTAYAQRQGFEVSEWIEVEGVSSKRSAAERRVDELARKLKRGDLLLVSELSRLSRSIRETLNVLDELGKRGVTTHIIRQGLTANGKGGALANGILANLAFAAELERELIGQRTKAALARKKAEGVKLGNPRLADLHARQDQKAHAHAQAVAPEIKKLAGMSQRRMVAALNEAGVKTVSGKPWRLCTLQAVLRRIEPS